MNLNIGPKSTEKPEILLRTGAIIQTVKHFFSNSCQTQVVLNNILFLVKLLERENLHVSVMQT